MQTQVNVPSVRPSIERVLDSPTLERGILYSLNPKFQVSNAASKMPLQSDLQESGSGPVREASCCDVDI